LDQTNYPLSSFAVCLGAQARAANETARRNYQYSLDKREKEWMQTLSVTNTERVMHEQGIDASNIGLSQVYGDIQAKFGDQIGQALQEDETNWKEFLQNNTGGKMAASGQTGRSAARVSTLELGEYLAKGSRQAYELIEGKRDMDAQGRKAAGIARSEQLQSFANNAIIKSPDLAPPKPVYQNVGAAAFMDALSIASSVASIYSAIPSSDRRLKENIQKIGESISGLGIYKFNYIGKAKQYIGAMADEVIKVVPEAAVLRPDGFYGVNYNLIDVTFKEV
tara:strand:+ start:7 stop:843 length:837 start_codon:yes stop_codon:yes gene_type:complete